MPVLVLGLSHQTAPIALREQVAIALRDLPDALRDVRALPPIDEAVILSTCNRTELYVTTATPAAAIDQLADFLVCRNRLDPQALARVLYRFTDAEAAGHLFRVAAGLESMVLGESEITAQIKQAYEIARGVRATGPMLNRLFQKALHSAKVVRGGTRIAEGHASIGSVVVSLADQLFEGQLGRCQVLLWGAGKAAETTVRHLAKRGVQRVWVVNRTQTKAEQLADLCQGGWVSWEHARAHLAHVDIAVVCTHAPHYVIDPSDLDAIAPQRAGRPLVLIDLAVPRNVDPALRRRPGVRLYDIDDLQTTAQGALAARQGEVARCEALIEQQVAHVARWRHAPSNQEAPPCPVVALCSSAS